MPGVTRDRHYGICRQGLRDHSSSSIPAGSTGDKEGIAALTARQVDFAIDEADVVLFVVDARDGLLPQDRNILDRLRRAGQAVAARRQQGRRRSRNNAPSPNSPRSASPLRCQYRPRTAAASPTLDGDADPRCCPRPSRMTTIGGRRRHSRRHRRPPNVGKSTLVNRLLGEERVDRFRNAGTTRDSISVALERDGKHYTLIDTAGMRRRARVEEASRNSASIKTLQSIAAANVVVVMLDAHEGVSEQDAT